jgi:hypothetical protein
MTAPGNNQTRYEVITQEDPATGDLLMPIPPELLRELGWKEGDEIEFGIDDSGNYILKRVEK